MRCGPRILFALAAAVIVAGLVTLLVVGLRAGEVDRSVDSAIAKGKLRAAPAFTLPLIANGSALNRRDGSSLSLSDLRGRPVVLNFWASWCDPCKREASILEAAWQAGKGEGAVVLGIDIQDLTSDALEFVATYKQTYPQVRDRGDGTYRSYGLTGVPETFFIDRAGRVRVHWVGEINATQIAAGMDVILNDGRP